MPATYINAFEASTTPAWRWSNANDAELIAFLAAHYDLSGEPRERNFAVDRTGSSPVLTWSIYEFDYGTRQYYDTGQTGAAPLETGHIYVGYRPYMQLWSLIKVETVQPDYWESDEHGRPYDLNDLLAES